MASIFRAGTIFGLVMSVAARNLAQKQAAMRKGFITEENGDDDGTATRPKIIVEDIGRPPADDNVMGLPVDTFHAKHQLQLPRARVMDVLTRTADLDVAGKLGRPRDMRREMQGVADVFDTELDDAAKAFQLSQHCNIKLGTSINQALQLQKKVAQSLREQQEGSAAETTQVHQEPEVEVNLLTQEALVLLQSKPPDLLTLGPVAVAKYLVEDATLNQDQQGPVSLIATAMETARERQGEPKLMKDSGKIVRMLLLGGGGCGETRIINLVLTALFQTFWGERGCVKTAPSNKPARGILGKTLHASAELRGGSFKMIQLRCSQKVQTALAYLWSPCGALIIDEAPQGAAALYHAVSLRCAYGRAAARDLEVADYAETSRSFGAMPVIIECGDELQLPPVPASARFFAEQTDVSTEHLAGVQIFKQKDYVYRLTTMKRVADDTQVAILTKMRQNGGRTLTSASCLLQSDARVCEARSCGTTRRPPGPPFPRRR
jgi:hypothetical protein